MLFVIRKCAFQIETKFFKQFLFYSTKYDHRSDQEEYVLNPKTEVILRREDSKFLKVAILGLPNSGKSTLTNQLTKRMICPVSSKVHTTMHKYELVYSEDDTQIVFMDTPGLSTSHEMKKYKLKETFKKDPQTSIIEADVIGILQDVTNVYTRHLINDFVLDYLKNKRDDSQLLLILNKIDKLKRKNVLLDLTRQLTTNEKYPKFTDVFMISGLTGNGVDDLRNYLLDSAKIKDWQYDGNVCTDQPYEHIVVQTVRAKLLDNLPHGGAYKIQVQVEHFDVGEDGSINILVSLKCPQSHYMSILLKNRGHCIKLTAWAIESDLRQAFRTNVVVKLSVEPLFEKKKITFN